MRVYEWDGTTWKMRGLEINGEHSGDLFGYSISLNSTGDVLAVGAPHDGTSSLTNVGSVSVYQYNGIEWNKLGDNKFGIENSEILVLQSQLVQMDQHLYQVLLVMIMV